MNYNFRKIEVNFKMDLEHNNIIKERFKEKLFKKSLKSNSAHKTSEKMQILIEEDKIEKLNQTEKKNPVIIGC